MLPRFLCSKISLFLEIFLRSPRFCSANAAHSVLCCWGRHWPCCCWRPSLSTSARTSTPTAPEPGAFLSHGSPHAPPAPLPIQLRAPGHWGEQLTSVLGLTCLHSYPEPCFHIYNSFSNVFKQISHCWKNVKGLI